MHSACDGDVGAQRGGAEKPRILSRPFQPFPLTLTPLQVALAPDAADRKNEHAMTNRLASMRRSGTFIAGHPSLNFEVHGINARKQAGSSPALDEIEVSLRLVSARPK